MNRKNPGKRVLMLVENNSFPEDTRIFHEATTLADAGYTVSVICQSTSNQPWHEVLGGIYVFRYPLQMISKGFLSYIAEYAYSLVAMFILSIIVLWKPGFDIIHAANPPDTAFIIAVFYKIFGKKFIFDHHDLSPEVYGLKFGSKRIFHKLVYKALLAMEKLSCKVANHVITTNDSYKTIEIKRDGISSDKITIVRNGPDLDKKPSSPSLVCIQEERKKILLYLGMIGFQDGVDYLIRSISSLINVFGKYNFICVIAGDGVALQGLKSMVLELGLSDFIKFSGWIEPSDVTSYINSADICLAPEPSNNLNNYSTMVKIMEYMAASKPVVAFDLPENKVTAQNAAIYAEPNNESDFAHKIAFLMDHPEKCKEMGQIAHDRIEKELSWTHQKVCLLDAYYKIKS